REPGQGSVVENDVDRAQALLGVRGQLADRVAEPAVAAERDDAPALPGGSGADRGRYCIAQAALAACKEEAAARLACRNVRCDPAGGEARVADDDVLRTQARGQCAHQPRRL